MKYKYKIIKKGEEERKERKVKIKHKHTHNKQQTYKNTAAKVNGKNPYTYCYNNKCKECKVDASSYIS